MTDTPTAREETFKQKVAACFAERPRLRDVLSHEGFTVLVDHYPWIRSNHPQLTSLDDFVILPSLDGVTPQRALLDVLLEHLLAGSRLQLTAADLPSIAPPRVFHAQEQGTDKARHPEITLNLAKLNDGLESLLGAWLERFQHAQIGFWNGLDEASQVSRMRWLEHTIQAALLCNLQNQGLSAAERATLYALLADIPEGISICAVNVNLTTADNNQPVTLPDLLLSTTQGPQGRVLWCKPGGRVRSFSDLPAFASALKEELAQRYQFDGLSWAQSAVVGDPFAFQARQLLNTMLGDIRRLRLGHLTSVGELQDQLHQLTDPSVYFLNQAHSAQGLPSVGLPAWLSSADAGSRYAYHTSLLKLAARQGQSKGLTSLGDIDDLQRYANRRLREQLQSRYPTIAQHDPDQVLISVSQAIIGSSVQGSQSLHLRNETLTDLAISRLHLGAGEVMTGVTVPGGANTDAWLSLEQIRALIHEVDVGGQYPHYLAAIVAVEPRRQERIRQYAREWRGNLMFSTLKANIQGQLSEPASNALLAFCQGSNDAQPLHIAPLAFLCAPGTSVSDRAHGMFLIKLPASHGWVLYRPFYADQNLLQFTGLDQMMAAIRRDGELQQSILDWLNDNVREVYGNGGFTHPHLHPTLEALAGMLGGESLVVDKLIEQLRQPVTARFAPWATDLDAQLFDARIEAMRLAASRSSLSNAQEKSALVSQVAWSLFNTVSLLWHGPLASLTWLMLALSAAKDDLSALANGTDEARIVAATDLLTDLAMLLAHRGAPTVADHPSTPQLRFIEPSEREITSEETPAQVHSPAPVRLYSWHDNQRVGNLSPSARESLVKLQASRSLEGLTPLSKGRLRGLYEIAGRHFVKLQGAAYEVQETWGGIQIVGPDQSNDEWASQWQGTPDDYHIVGRERSRGPWLARWNGEWAINLRLAGGMPRTSKAINAENQQRYTQLRETASHNSQELARLEPLMERNRQQLTDYDDLATEYSLAFLALPAQERAKPPAALVLHKQELLARRRQLATELRASSLFLEKQGVLLEANVRTFMELSEPRFLRLDITGTNARRYSTWLEAAIDNDMLLCRRLLEQVDHEQLVAQANGLHRLPQGAEQLQRYVAYRTCVRDSLQATRRLLVVSQRLDRAIPEALENPKVDYADKAGKLDRVIKRRTYSTLVIRAQLLSDLAYLTVDKTVLTPEAADNLLPLREVLSNNELSRTIWSHDGLAMAEGSSEDKAEVLDDVLRRYRAILDKAHYMQSFSDPALDRAILDEYINELTKVANTTEAQLSAALADLEKGIVPPPPRALHRATPGKRTVIRVGRRPALVEAQGDHAVQRNPISQQPAGNYERSGDEWHEQAAEPRTDEPDIAQLRLDARQLLAQVDEKIAFAARYADQPNSLNDFLDWPIIDMEELSQRLATIDSDLVSQLRQAAARVGERKQQLLTNAYLNTRHPDSTALRYLLEQRRVSIAPSVLRRPLRQANDYLDVYEIRDIQAPRAVLWEAHFHYRSPDAKAHDFVKGHLKFRDPREKNRDASLELAPNAKERIAIYRGDLRLAQVADIIPFPPESQ